MATNSNSLLSSLSNIRENGEYSDLRVLCGLSGFNVHRFIVCPQSRFFENATKNNFQEAKLREITLHDDPFIVAKMIDYLYWEDYDDSPESTVNNIARETNNTSSTSSIPVEETRLGVNIQVYNIAHEYGIDKLKDLAKKKFESLLKEKWEGRWKDMWKHGWDGTEFISIIECVYGLDHPLNSTLREVVSRFAVDMIDRLEEAKRFQEVMGEFSGFLFDFSLRLMRRIHEM